MFANPLLSSNMATTTAEANDSKRTEQLTLGSGELNINVLDLYWQTIRTTLKYASLPVSIGCPFKGLLCPVLLSKLPPWKSYVIKLIISRYLEKTIQPFKILIHRNNFFHISIHDNEYLKTVECIVTAHFEKLCT